MQPVSIFLLLCISSIFCAKADIMIMDGDTTVFSVTQSALEQYPDIQKVRKLLFPQPGEPCFDCTPVDYVAEWTVIDNTLYLNAIYTYHISSKKADLSRFFKVKNSRVKADWVNAEFWIPVGKHLRSRDMSFIYGAEVFLSIKNGRIIKRQKYNYPTEPRLTKEEIDAFIYSKINWDKIPDLGDKEFQVLISLVSAAMGKPENVRVRRKTDCSICDEEALHAIKVMPWPGDYSQGKILPLQWSLSIIFSEEQRKKYAH